MEMNWTRDEIDVAGGRAEQAKDVLPARSSYVLRGDAVNCMGLRRIEPRGSLEIGGQ